MRFAAKWQSTSKKEDRVEIARRYPFAKNLEPNNREAQKGVFTLATLNLNFAAVGLVVLAAVVTQPDQYPSRAPVDEVRTGVLPVIRFATPIDMQENVVSTAEPMDAVVELSTTPPEAAPIAVEPEAARVANKNDLSPPSSELTVVAVKPHPQVAAHVAKTTKKISAADEVQDRDLPGVATNPTAVISQKDGVRDTEAEQTIGSSTFAKALVTPTNDQLAERLFAEAVSLVENGQYVDAENRLRVISKQFPTFAKATELLVVLLLEERRTDDAINTLYVYTQRDNRNLKMKKWLARLYIENHRHESAIDLVKAMLADQLDSDNLVLLANLYQQLGQYEDAKNIFITALELNKLDFKSWLGLALTYENLGQRKEAYSTYSYAQHLSTNWEISQFIKTRLVALESRPAS